MQSIDLGQFIDQSAAEGLNTRSEHPVANVFVDDPSVVKSDSDQELIIKVVFRQPIKLAAVRFFGTDDAEENPTEVKIFQSKPDIGFDEAQAEEASAALALDEDEQNGKEKLVKFVKFQNVSTLQIFVGQNGGGDVTTIRHIKFIGQAAEKMDMKEFKPVKG